MYGAKCVYARNTFFLLFLIYLLLLVPSDIENVGISNKQSNWPFLIRVAINNRTITVTIERGDPGGGRVHKNHFGNSDFTDFRPDRRRFLHSNKFFFNTFNYTLIHTPEPLWIITTCGTYTVFVSRGVGVVFFFLFPTPYV